MSISKDIIEAELRTKGGNKVRSQMADISKELRKLKGENERLKVAKAKLEAQGKKNTKEWKQLNDQIKKNNAEITRQKGQYKQLNSQLGLTEKSAQELRQEASQLRRELNRTSKATEPKRWKQLNRQLERTEKQYKKVRAGTSRTSKMMGTLKDALPVAGIGAAVAGLGRLISKWARWQTQLEKTRHQVRQLTNATDAHLDSLTAKTQAVSKTFNTDLKRVSESANNLAKNMNISYGQAMDLIKEGFVAGADASGEFLDIIREYPAILNEVGLNAEESMAIITQQVKQGVFSDKGIDAIKEANIRIREMTTATSEAIDSIGLSSDKIQQQLTSGEKSIFEVIQMISERMSELPPQSQKVGTAIADIFGEPGENVGLEFLTTLQDINTNMDEVVSDTDKYAKAQRELVEANEMAAESMNAIFGEGSWWTRKKADFKKWWASYLGALRQLPIALNTVKDGLGMAHKDFSKFQDTLLNTVPSLKKLSEEVRQYGIETDKGKEALTELNTKLVETYGSKGLKIAQSFTEEQRKLAQERIEKRKEEADANQDADNKTEKSFKELNKAMERQYKERTLELKQQLAQQKISQEQFNDEMQIEELAYLASKKGLYERFGKDTLELEEKIANKQIALNEKVKNVTVAQGEQLRNQLKKDLNETDQWMESWADRMNQNLLDKTTKHRQKINDILNQSYLQSLWDLKRALNRKEITQEEYNKAVEERSKAEAKSWAMSGAAAVENAKTVEGAAENVLNSIRKQVKAYLMEALASTIANALGSVPFPANIALATTAAAAASALFDKLIPKADFTPDSQGASQQKLPQRASGTLDVVGEEDGRLYRNIPYQGTIQGVGVANQGRPVIMNERGGEIIADAETSDNIRMKNPALIEEMKSYSPKMSQRAEGTLRDGNSTDLQKTLKETNRNNRMMAGVLQQLSEQGVQVNWGYRDTRNVGDQMKKMNRIKDDIG